MSKARPEITLEQELADLLNRHSVENESNTPDFILAEFLTDCLDAWGKAQRARQKWFVPNPVIDPSFDQGTPPDLR